MSNDLVRLLASPRWLKGPLPWFAALFIAANFGVWRWQGAIHKNLLG